MAKKKNILTLDEVRRCVNLHKSFHDTSKVNIEILAKELGVKKLDLWEFVLSNEEYFIIKYYKPENSNIIKYRFITEVLESPMSQEEYIEMIERSDYRKYRD